MQPACGLRVAGWSAAAHADLSQTESHSLFTRVPSRVFQQSAGLANQQAQCFWEVVEL